MVMRPKRQVAANVLHEHVCQEQKVTNGTVHGTANGQGLVQLGEAKQGSVSHNEKSGDSEPIIAEGQDECILSQFNKCCSEDEESRSDKGSVCFGVGNGSGVKCIAEGQDVVIF